MFFVASLLANHIAHERNLEVARLVCQARLIAKAEKARPRKHPTGHFAGIRRLLSSLAFGRPRDSLTPGRARRREARANEFGPAEPVLHPRHEPHRSPEADHDRETV